MAPKIKKKTVTATCPGAVDSFQCQSADCRFRPAEYWRESGCWKSSVLQGTNLLQWHDGEDVALMSGRISTRQSSLDRQMRRLLMTQLQAKNIVPRT